jgi:hypothetical protein
MPLGASGDNGNPSVEPHELGQWPNRHLLHVVPFVRVLKVLPLTLGSPRARSCRHWTTSETSQDLPPQLLMPSGTAGEREVLVECDQPDSGVPATRRETVRVGPS